MEGQLLTMVQVTALLGIILPPFVALVKRTDWAKRKKDLAILGVLIVVGAVAGFLCGDIDPRACASTGLPECLTIVVGYISLTVTQALAWFKMYWEDSALENKIAGK